MFRDFPWAWSPKSLQNPLFYWWAARVSIPAPWECFQNVQWRLSTSKFTGWMEWNVHQRPQKSSLV